MADGGTWQGPHSISGDRVGRPGGKLIAVAQRGDQLDVLFIGLNRRPQVAWVSGIGTWAGPISFGDAGVPYPAAGSGIAACRQGADQLDFFFIGEDGGFYVAWAAAGRPWTGPIRVSPAGARVSVPGAGLAAFDQADAQVTVLFVDLLGRLASMFVIGGGVWQGPAPAVAQAPLARPGSDAALVGGAAIAALVLTGAVAVLLVRSRPVRPVLIGACVALVLGLLITLFGVRVRSGMGFFIGTLIAGVGFGAGFNAIVRSLVPLAPPHERGALMSAYFVCSYLAFSVPTVVVGLAVGVFGLEQTALGYGLLLVAMTGVVLARVGRERR